MKIEKTQNGDFLQLTISGDLDASSSIKMDEVLCEAYTNPQYTVHIDCTQLNYISSAGVGVFISHLENFERQQGSIILCNTQPHVYNVFEMLGLLNLMKIYKHEIPFSSME